jgi:branched-chain amino acid transport system ATP-binding protein
MQLNVSSLTSGYGQVRIINDISLTVKPAEIIAVIGRNGVGKTTLIKTIMGILPAMAGTIVFGDTDVTRLSSTARARRGIGYVPQGRGIFTRMTVAANLALGAGIGLADRPNLERAFSFFPILERRLSQLAGSMSGGEQQMLALGRAMMLSPKIMLVDEPSVGLAPILVSRMIDAIAEMKARYSLTVLMAEQNFTQAIRIADRGYVIVHGKIAFEGNSADALNNNDLIKKFYLGL